MGALISKPDWVDSKIDGELICKSCTYKSDSEEFLAAHVEKYHTCDQEMILYMGCTGSIEGRSNLVDGVDAQWMDMTGGQAAFHDGDLKTFGDQLVAGAREHGLKLYHVVRMHDPGLGLEFPWWWVEAGVKAGVFQQYELPEDVRFKEGDAEGEDDEDPGEVKTEVEKDEDVSAKEVKLES